MATYVSSISNFSLNSYWSDYDGGSTSQTTKTFSFPTSGLPSGSTVTDAVLTADLGTPQTGIDICTANDSNFIDESYDVTGVTPGGSKNITFKFAAVGGTEGTHTATLTFSNVKITVTYTPPHTDPTVTNVKLGGSLSAKYKVAGDSINLTWTSSGGTNNTIQSHQIQRSANDGSFITPSTGTWTANASTKTLSVTAHLTAGSNFRFRVRAIGELSNSAWVISPYLYSYSSPTKPTTVTANPTSQYCGQDISLSWSGQAAGVGVSISKFEIYEDNVYLKDSVTSPATITVPFPENTYVYKVKSIGSVSGYDSAISTASASVTTTDPSSTFVLDKSTVPLDGTTEITCTITPLEETYSHTVRWYIDETYTQISDTIEQPTQADTVTLPQAWCEAFTSATSGTATCLVTTYDGVTPIGTSSLTFTVTVPASVIPTISAFTCASDGTGDFASYYLKGINKCTTTTTASGVYGSTIAWYSTSIKFGSSGETYTGASASNEWTTGGVLNTAGTYTATVTVTDSRGRTATDTEDVVVTNYSNPVITISSNNYYRSDSDGTYNNDGTYIRLLATSSVTAIGDPSINPQVTFTAKYKANSGSVWSAPVALTSGVQTVLGSVEDPILETLAYQVTITLTDTVGKTSSTVFPISVAARMFDFRNDRSGIGCVAGDASTLKTPDTWTVISGDFESKVTTGTAPQTVASETQVSNLNADKLDGKHANELGNKRNLLHNWDFRYPVNQRELTTYDTDDVYTIDRWKKNEGVVILTEGIGITLDTDGEGYDNWFYQIVEPRNIVSTATYTFSVEDTSDNVYSVTGVFNTTPVQEATSFGLIEILIVSGAYIVRVDNETTDVVLRRAKQELGDSSTIANDDIMDYHREFAVCETYYWRRTNRSATYRRLLGDGYSISTTEAQQLARCPVMNSIPSIEYSDVGDIYINHYIINAATGRTATAVEIQTEFTEKEGVVIKITATNLAAVQIYFVALEPEGWIALSADLTDPL